METEKESVVEEKEGEMEEELTAHKIEADVAEEKKRN